LLKSPPRTSAEEIRLQLASRIISGELKPGTALDETSLAAEFSVSRTPIREALRLLAASGLVDQKPHTKTLVAKPDEETLAGMFQVMGHLEALCAGLSAIAMTSAERHDLEQQHYGMESIVRAGDVARYAVENERFHDLVYNGAHNAYLAEITHQTRQRLQPFRRAQFDAPARVALSHMEHGALVQAILRGQRREAERAMLTHMAIVENAYQQLSGGG
jgi:DNA-binding GntR family transcriptional regulator